MLDQNTLTEVLREVAEIVKTSEETMSREEILGYFEQMDLDENQKNLILDYLLKTQDFSKSSGANSSVDDISRGMTADAKNGDVSMDYKSAGNEPESAAEDADEFIDITEDADEFIDITEDTDAFMNITEDMYSTENADRSKGNDEGDDYKKDGYDSSKMNIYSDPEIREVMSYGEEEKNFTVDVRETETGKDGHYPNSTVFKMYLEELEGLKVYEGAALEQLYQQLLGGDMDVIQKISESWMRRILVEAGKLTVADEDFGDVIQEGNMALFMVLSELCGCGETMDVDAAIDEATQKAMKSYVQELTGEKDVRNAMLGKATLVYEAQEYLAKENMQVPTLEELSDFTRIPENELKDIME